MNELLTIKAVDCLVGMNLLNTDWHEYRTSIIDLSDTNEAFALVTVLWQDETGDEHTAIVRVNSNFPAAAHMVLYGLNVA